MIFLASRSPRRRRLLRQCGRPFRVVRSSYQEHIIRGATPSANAVRNAVGKARGAQLPRGTRTGVILGADTFLWFRGRVIGKPRDLAHARQLFRTLSGRAHWVYTGLCLRDAASGREWRAYARSRVLFKPLAEKTIQRLCRRMRPLDKAGGYALQEDRGELIARIEGSVTNVVGLPLELLRRMLRKAGTRTNLYPGDSWHSVN